MLQQLLADPSPGAAAPLCAGSRHRLPCRVIGVVGGMLWWGALLGVAVRPDAAGVWQSAVAAGGWGLGLIPLHAVPTRVPRSRTARGRASAG